MPDNAIHLTLDLPDFSKVRDAIKVVSFTCDEGINRLYRLEVVIGVGVTAGDGLSASDFLGKAARLVALNRSEAFDYDSESMKRTSTKSPEEFVDGSGRLFTGRIAECRHLGDYAPPNQNQSEVRSFFHLVAFPDAWRLARKESTTSYIRAEGVTLTPKDCIEDLLNRHKAGNVGDNEHPVDWDLDIADDYALKQGPSCVVQFHEPDFDFLLRWVERQGWFFRFLPGEKDVKEKADSYVPEKLVVQSGPKIERLGLGNSQLLRKAQGSDMKMGIHAIRSTAAEYPVQIYVQDYNPDDPCADLLITYPEKPRESGLTATALKGEFFATHEEGEALAKVRMETYEAHSTSFEGDANVPGMMPGLSFLLYDDAKPDDKSSIAKGTLDSAWADKAYFITSAKHAATTNQIDAAVVEAVRKLIPSLPPTGYAVRFGAVRYRPTYHPKKTASWPKITQAVTGFALALDGSKNKDKAVTTYGKYYVGIPNSTPSPLYARDPGSIGPVRALQSDKERSGGSGDAIVPGSEVVLTFTGGNPDRAVISGSIPNDYSKTYHYFNQDGVGLNGNEAAQGQQILNSVYSPISTSQEKNGKNVTSIGTSKGSAPAIQVSSDSGSKDVHVLSTYMETKTTTINASSSGISKSSANFTNTLSASSGVDTWSVVALLDELQKKVMEVKSEVNEHKTKKIDYQTDEIITMTCKLSGQLATISKLVKAFIEFGDNQSMSQRERISIMSTPNKATIGMRSILLTDKDKFVQITRICSQFVSDLKEISATYRQMEKMAKELYGSAEHREKVRKALEERQRKKMGLPKDVAVPLPACQQAMHVMAHIDFWARSSTNVASVIKDFMMFVKFLQHVIRQDVGNSGIRIQACNRKDSKARTSWKDTLALIKAKDPAAIAATPLTVNKIAYDKTKGLNLQLLADGPVRLKSEDTLYIGVYKESIEPFTDEPQRLPKKAVIQMGRDRTDNANAPWETSMRVAVEKMGVRAKSMSAALGDDGFRVETITENGKKSGLVVQGKGGFRLTAHDEGALNAKKALHISTEGNFSTLGKSLTLASTGAGISLGFVDGKKPSSMNLSKPFIGLSAISPSDAAKFIKAKETLLDKERIFAEKFSAYRTAKEKVDILAEKVGVVWDEFAKDDNVQTQAILTDVKGKYTAAKTALETKTTELKAAKTEWETALTTLENISASSASKNLTLANGKDGNQSLVISDKDMQATSDKEIGLKAGSTTAKFSANSVEIKCGRKVVLKGGTVDIG